LKHGAVPCVVEQVESKNLSNYGMSLDDMAVPVSAIKSNGTNCGNKPMEISGVVKSALFGAGLIVAFYIFGKTRKTKKPPKPVEFSSNFSHVTVVIGGTSGIGQGVSEVFARETQGKAKLIIVGRNAKAAQEIFASLPKPTSPENYEFVQCDIMLMKNVAKAVQKIKENVSKINYLVISAGAIELKTRQETEEGLMDFLALVYYSRWKFINDLLPLLKKAQENKEDAKVLSIFSAGGLTGKIDADDLELKKKLNLNAPGTYNDLMVEVSSCCSQSSNFVFSNSEFR
jgi:hypothetical protein